MRQRTEDAAHRARRPHDTSHPVTVATRQRELTVDADIRAEHHTNRIGTEAGVQVVPLTKNPLGEGLARVFRPYSRESATTVRPESVRRYRSVQLKKIYAYSAAS